MKQTSYRQIKQIGETVTAEYLTLEEAAFSTGFPKERLLKWCQEHNIGHIKRKNRWLVNKKDLVAAMSQDLSDKAS